MMSVVERLERCLTAVSHWMAANRFKLNAEKTELLWTGSRYSAAVLANNGPSLKLGQDTVTPSNRVRDLGVTFSSDLRLSSHKLLWCNVFLLAPSVQTSSTLIGRRRHEDAGPRLHYFARGLLQRNSCRVAEVHNWHFTACAECSSSSRHKHWQVRPWSVESTSWPVAVAQRPDRIEYKLAVMVYTGVLRTKSQRSSVLERPLHSGHRRQQPTPLTISRPASTDCTALSVNYIRPSGFLSCEPDGLDYYWVQFLFF